MFDITTTDSVAVEAVAAAKRLRKPAAATPASTSATNSRRPARATARAATPATAETAAAKPLCKSALVLKLLGRSKGATIAEMEEPTGWQPHSTRAFLSGLRKKGMTVTRERRRSGETSYRTGEAESPPAQAVTNPLGDSATSSSDNDTGANANIEALADATASTHASTDMDAAAAPRAAI